MVCKELLKNQFSNDKFKCFIFDEVNCIIELFDRKENEKDALIFEELKIITDILSKCDVDYHITDEGSIVIEKVS